MGKVVLSNEDLGDFSAGICMVLSLMIAALPPESRDAIAEQLARISAGEGNAHTLPAAIVLQQLRGIEEAIRNAEG